MIKLLLFSKFSGLFILVNLMVYEGFGATKTFSPNLMTGVWSSATDWSPNGVPSGSDDVLIPTGKTCILDIPVVRSGSLTIQSSAVLDANQPFEQMGSAIIEIQTGGKFDLRGVRISLQSSLVSGILTTDQTTDLYYSAATAGTHTPQLTMPKIKNFYLSSDSKVGLGGDILIAGKVRIEAGSELNVGSHKISIREVGAGSGQINYTAGPAGSELEYYGDQSFTFEGAGLKSLSCKTTGTVTLGSNTTIGNLLYIETGCTLLPESGISITPFAEGFDVVNKGNYNPKIAASTLNPGKGIFTNEGTYFHSGSQTFQNLNNMGIYQIQSSQSLTVTESFTNGAQGQFNPDNSNATVNIAITGANSFTNLGRFQGKSNTLIHLNSSVPVGFVNAPGAVFNFEGILVCESGLTNSGAFNAQEGQINLVGSGVVVTANSPIEVGRILNSGSATLAGNAPLNLYDALTIPSSGTLDLDGKNLVLKSTAAKTARIAPIVGTLSNATQVTQERFVSGISSGWYFLGSSISGQTFADWIDDFDIRGPFPGASVSTSGDHSSMFVYDGSVPPTGANPAVEVNGWRLPTTGSIEPGKGYRSNLPAKFFTGPKIIDNTGTVNQGTFSFDVTFDPSGYDGGGWNFLSNPYPSSLDWNSAGWTKSNINSALYVFNGATGQYGAYVPGNDDVEGTVYSGTNGISSMIASGQAFFIKANSSDPLLKATESVKSGFSASFMRTATPTAYGSFKIALLNKDNYADENVIRFGDEATVDFDGKLDALKMVGSVLNLSSSTPDGKRLCINTLPNFNSEGYIMPLNVSVNIPETYQLSFTQFQERASQMVLLLHDKYLSTVTSITENSNYKFTVNSDPNSQGSDRFEIILGGDKEIASMI